MFAIGVSCNREVLILYLTIQCLFHHQNPSFLQQGSSLLVFVLGNCKQIASGEGCWSVSNTSSAMSSVLHLWAHPQAHCASACMWKADGSSTCLKAGKFGHSDRFVSHQPPRAPRAFTYQRTQGKSCYQELLPLEWTSLAITKREFIQLRSCLG